MRTSQFLLCLTINLLCSLEAIAQSHHINVYGGANYSTLGHEVFDLWKPGPSIGLGYEKRFTDILFLETGIVYNERGARQSYDRFTQESNLQTHHPPVVFKHHYLSIPVALGLRTHGKFAVFAEVGTVFSRILRSTSEFVTPNEQQELEYDNKSYHPALDLTLQLGTGAIVQFSNRVEAFAKGSFEYGVNNTYGNSGGDPHIGFLGQPGLKYQVGRLFQ